MKDLKNIAKQMKGISGSNISRAFTGIEPIKAISNPHFSRGRIIGFTSSSSLKKADNFSLGAIQKIVKGANSITLATSSYNFVKKGSIADRLNKMKIKYNPKWDIYYMSEDVKQVGSALRKSISKMKDQD